MYKGEREREREEEREGGTEGGGGWFETTHSKEKFGWRNSILADWALDLVF